MGPHGVGSQGLGGGPMGHTSACSRAADDNGTVVNVRPRHAGICRLVGADDGGVVTDQRRIHTRGVTGGRYIGGMGHAAVARATHLEKKPLMCGLSASPLRKSGSPHVALPRKTRIGQMQAISSTAAARALSRCARAGGRTVRA